MDEMTITTEIAPIVIPDHVRPDQLVGLIGQISQQIKVLSLDCFDTLLWRSVATPADAFYDLQQSPTFKSLNITARLRRQAESTAREMKHLRAGTNEVTLHDIYQFGFEGLSSSEINQLIEEELALEQSILFSFQPVINFIRAAHQHGIKIIIVSDTYFTANQVFDFLKATCPADVASMISEIYCSCEKRRSKTTGLFKHILERLSQPAHAVLHIGDNPLADFNSPKRHGLHAVKLIAQDEHIHELMRMIPVAASFINPRIRNDQSCPMLYHGLTAANTALLNKEDYAVGYAVLGPILYAFAQFIKNHTQPISKNGKRVKLLFLLRDGYLPSLAFKKLVPDQAIHCVRISRFSAYAASFHTEDDINHYLAGRVKAKHFTDYCKQFLLPDDITQTILQKTLQANDPINEFIRQIHKPSTQHLIFKSSDQYKTRLLHHLKNEANIEAGDHLVFVDLGYTGTAQLKLEPILKREWDVDVSGCYLLSLSSGRSSDNHFGLLDQRHFDDNALTMMVSYIALLEQLCTSPESSTVNYDAEGHAVYSPNIIDNAQYNRVKAVQAECLRFIDDVNVKNQSEPLPYQANQVRDMAAISLCRFLFLPTHAEIAYFEKFMFDFNMGSDELIPLFDVEKGLTGLRKRGWLFCAKENSITQRTNFSSEWRSAGLELSLTLMTQHRYQHEYAHNDISHLREQLTLMVFQSNHPTELMIDAYPTNQGYYSIAIPIVDNTAKIGVMFGSPYQWVQIEAAELINIAHYNTALESTSLRSAASCLSLNDMTHHADGLFECLSPQGFLLFDPANQENVSGSILRIVFRPIACR